MITFPYICGSILFYYFLFEIGSEANTLVWSRTCDSPASAS